VQSWHIGEYQSGVKQDLRNSANAHCLQYASVSGCHATRDVGVLKDAWHDSFVSGSHSATANTIKGMRMKNFSCLFCDTREYT
jgi:hypothetical protein